MKSVLIWKHAIDPHRIGDVLDFAITERFVSANKFVLYLLVDAARDVNLARLRYSLTARGNIDPVAINVVWFGDNVAKIDPDPILDPVMLRQRCVAFDHALPDGNAASRGFDGAIENRNKSIAREI